MPARIRLIRRYEYEAHGVTNLGGPGIPIAQLQQRIDEALDDYKAAFGTLPKHDSMTVHAYDDGLVIRFEAEEVPF
ncbi:hypothetical protein ACWFRF_20645 [Nocardia sp. NPDC055165]